MADKILVHGSRSRGGDDLINRNSIHIVDIDAQTSNWFKPFWTDDLLDSNSTEKT